MATKPARKPETTIDFNKVAVPARAAVPNPFQNVIDYLNGHVDDAEGAVEFNHDRPGYALGKIRSDSAEDIGFDRFGVVVASWTEGVSSLLAEVDASSQEDTDAWAAYVSRGDRVHQ